MDKFKEAYINLEKPLAEDMESSELYHKLAEVLHPDKNLGYEELMLKLNLAKENADVSGDKSELEGLYRKYVRSEKGEPAPGDNIDIKI